MSNKLVYEAGWPGASLFHFLGLSCLICTTGLVAARTFWGGGVAKRNGATCLIVRGPGDHRTEQVGATGWYSPVVALKVRRSTLAS